MVVVNRYIAGMANRCVWLENSQAAKTATLHLTEQGHRCIACVTSDLPIIDRRERLEGYSGRWPNMALRQIKLGD